MHATQLVDADAATVVEYKPAMQFVHAADDDAPDVSKKVPRIQDVHVLEEAAPIEPEKVPAGQLVQVETAWPVAVKYVPAMHGKHAEAPLIVA